MTGKKKKKGAGRKKKSTRGKVNSSKRIKKKDSTKSILEKRRRLKKENQKSLRRAKKNRDMTGGERENTGKRDSNYRGANQDAKERERKRLQGSHEKYTEPDSGEKYYTWWVRGRQF